MPPIRESPNYKKALYKTELCLTWAKNRGKCRYAENCQYAHGYVELRDVPRHPLYKTEPCFSFYFTKQCPYGNRCNFIHELVITLANGCFRYSEDLFKSLPFEEAKRLRKLKLENMDYWGQAVYQAEMNNAYGRSSPPTSGCDNSLWNIDAPPFYPSSNEHNSTYTNSTLADSIESFMEPQFSQTNEQNTSSDLEPFTAGFTIAHQFLKECKNLHLCVSTEDLFESTNEKIPCIPGTTANNRLPVFKKLTANKKH